MEENVPAGQGEQAAESEEVLYVPSAHGVQLPSDDVEPGSQEMGVFTYVVASTEGKQSPSTPSFNK